MADARHALWHRAGPTGIAVSALLIGLASPGCGGPAETTTGTGGSTTSTTTTGGTGGTGATGGSTGGTTSSSGGTTSSGGSTGELTVEAVSGAADGPGAIDSTPDSTGAFIYFTGTKAGEAGVFKVPGNGGAVSELFVGGRLAAPFGISIDSADNNLFVADPGYDVTDDDPDTQVGAILTLAVDGGTPAVVTGTEGYRPRGIDVFDDTVSGDILYFTGIDPATGEPGVFSRLASGGAVTSVTTGAPFVAPSGIAVGSKQTFVTDTLGTDERLASILVLDDVGNATSFLDGLGVGYPAGVALSADEKTLYVSGIDLDTQTDRILIIDVATKAVMAFGAQGVSDNTDAGGLHRARKTDVFSWADLTAGGAGTVFRISFK